jgi:hypothetical protein
MFETTDDLETYIVTNYIEVMNAGAMLKYGIP